MFEEKIVRLEADLFMAIDFGADGCTAVYCEVRKLADGTLLVEEFGPYTASGFQSIWKRVMTKFMAAGGVRFHEHDLRGKVATDMDDPVAAQKLLGHKDMSMTEDYIKARQTEVVKPHTRKKKE